MFNSSTKQIETFTPATGWDMMKKLGIGITFALTTESRIWPWISEVTINYPTDSEICFGQPKIEEWHFKSAAMKGFDSYRMCVTWTPHMDENGIISKEWLDRIQQLTDWALNAGLNVVINTMHEEELYWLIRDRKYNAAKKHLTALWSQIAERFKDYPETLLFEIMNEPNLLEHYHGEGEWITVNGQISRELCNTVNKLNQDALDVIRNSGGNNDKRVIILCVPGASPQALPYMKIPENDRYVMFGVFGYDDRTSLEKDIIPPMQAWIDKGIAVVNKEDNSWSDMTHTKKHYDMLAGMRVPSFYFSSFYYSAIGDNDNEDIGFLDLTTGEWKNKTLLKIFFTSYGKKPGPDFKMDLTKSM